MENIIRPYTVNTQYTNKEAGFNSLKNVENARAKGGAIKHKIYIFVLFGRRHIVYGSVYMFTISHE